jgi:hypothetical protein
MPLYKFPKGTAPAVPLTLGEALELGSIGFNDEEDMATIDTVRPPVLLHT